MVTVKTISYTGWKLVGVVPMETFSMGLEETRYLVILLVALALLATMILNQLVSARIAKPLKKLNDSVKEWEAGNLEPDIYVGGSLEVAHLGKTLQSTVAQIRQLMKDIVTEQEEKRKSELDALQSQINPHFLYNTLDSIVWMAEGGNNRQVVEMTTDLSDFFRTVLSGGNDFITIAEEESHIRSYLKIQKIRYEDILDYRINIEPSIKGKIILKMILQPIVENALYHGIKNKRGGGTIIVRGYEDRNGIIFEVEDDGIGMNEEMLRSLRQKLKGNGNIEVSKKGGFGLNNVAQRLRMYYGEGADITVESETDVGTCIKVYLGSFINQNRKKT